MKILVAYDGILSSKDVLRHGLKKAHDNAGEVIILHVFNREFLHYYDATPQVEDKLRSDFNLAATEAESIIRQEGNGVRASIVQFDSSPERDLLRYAEDARVDMVLYPKTFTSVVRRYSAIMREHGIAVTPLALRTSEQCTKQALDTALGTVPFAGPDRISWNGPSNSFFLISVGDAERAWSLRTERSFRGDIDYLASALSEETGEMLSFDYCEAGHLGLYVTVGEGAVCAEELVEAYA